MNAVAEAKLEMLKGSSRCLLYGGLSLLPLAGLPLVPVGLACLPIDLLGLPSAFGPLILVGMLASLNLPLGLAAVVVSEGIRRQEREVWNPAQPYRVIGKICGGVGMVLFAGLLVFALADAIWV